MNLIIGYLKAYFILIFNFNKSILKYDFPFHNLEQFLKLEIRNSIYFMKKKVFCRLFSLLLNLLLPSFYYSENIEGCNLKNGKALLVKMPAAYDYPTGKRIELATAERTVRKQESFWPVYSDRENNPTYFDKKCKKENIKLHFLECFVVAEETDDAVRLVRFDPIKQPFVEKQGTKKGELVFKENVEDVGWIKKKYLLLWDNSIVNETTKLSKKALLNSGQGESIQNSNSVFKVNLYNYPENISKNKILKIRNAEFRYLFVLKEDSESKMILVSETKKIRSNLVKEEILGWMLKNQLLVFDNSISLRPNYDLDAIAERKEKSFKVLFFKDLEGAKTYRDLGTSVLPNLEYFDADNSEHRYKNPFLYGFPILDKVENENDIYKVLYFENSDNIDAYNNPNFDFFLQAFASLSNKKLSLPLYNKALVLSRDEYLYFIEIFGMLSDCYSSSNQRQNIINKYREIIRARGCSVNYENFGKYSLNYYSELITGLYGIKKSEVSQRTFDDVLDKRKTSFDDIIQLKNAYARISTKLRNIKNNKNFWLEQEEETFYWIPENLFYIDYLN